MEFGKNIVNLSFLKGEKQKQRKSRSLLVKRGVTQDFKFYGIVIVFLLILSGISSYFPVGVRSSEGVYTFKLPVTGDYLCNDS